MVYTGEVILGPDIGQGTVGEDVESAPIAVSTFDVKVFMVPVGEMHVLRFVTYVPDTTRMPVGITVDTRDGTVVDIICGTFVVSLF